MDFLDWCQIILARLEREKFNAPVGNYELQDLLFEQAVREQADFHESKRRHGMFQALEALQEAGLAESESYSWKITPLGRKVLADPTDYWTDICAEELDSEEQAILHLVNRTSQQSAIEPFSAWLEETIGETVLAEFKVKPPPPTTNEHMDELHKYLYNLPGLLEDRGLLKADGRAGYGAELLPTYQGLVWGTRRGFTIESKFIDTLVAEWETTNVDFKREIKLDTKEQKAEFAKDVLGLATTKSSGRRFMIIGFHPKTREYFAPPDLAITQDRMEQILANLTEPVVNIRYEAIDYRAGKVGKLEVLREVEKLPYRAKQDVVVDAKGRKGLEKNRVYVRHGSQTESPSDAELAALIKEGRRARNEPEED